jgi:hypothetical protein
MMVLYTLIFVFLDSNLEDKRFCTEWQQKHSHTHQRVMYKAACKIIHVWPSSGVTWVNLQYSLTLHCLLPCEVSCTASAAGVERTFLALEYLM